MRIGELAYEAGTSCSAIRYYERARLIRAEARVGGQRRFAPSDVQTLRFIQLAQAGGFSISEIRTMVEGYAGGADLDEWRALAAEKKKGIGRKIAELQRMDAVLDALLTCECATIAECVVRCSSVAPEVAAAEH